MQMRVAGHCFTITETTQTFTKILTFLLKHYLKHSVGISKGSRVVSAFY